MNGQKVVRWQKGVILHANGTKSEGCGKVFRLLRVKGQKNFGKKKHAEEIHFPIT